MLPIELSGAAAGSGVRILEYYSKFRPARQMFFAPGQSEQALFLHRAGSKGVPMQRRPTVTCGPFVRPANQNRRCFCTGPARRDVPAAAADGDLRAFIRPAGQNRRCFCTGPGSKGVSSWWRLMVTSWVFLSTPRPLGLDTLEKVRVML